MPKKLDLFREEPLLTNTSPVATNSLTSRATFYQRKLYELVAFNSSLVGDTKPIDFWYEKTFYGRVDPDSKAVHLSEGFLKQIPDTADLFAVNFVVDAFEDLRSFFGYMNARGALETNSVYRNLKPRLAWVNVNLFYHEYMSAIFEKFKGYVSTYKKDDKIKDFDSFVNVFLEFVDSITPLVPLSRSKLIVSRYTDPKVSGLIIELDDRSHANDEPKIESFLNDANFPVFKESAQRFGFVVDQHAPWRIVADLGSPAMKPYLEAYGLTVEEMFKEYYYTSYEFDLAALKAYVVQFYNSYVSGKGVINKPQFSYDKAGRIKVKNEQIVRTGKTLSQIDETKTDEYWLRFYLFIRGREQNKTWNQHQFEKLVKNAFSYLKGVDFETALRYVENNTRTSMQTNKKERDFYFI